MVTAKHCPAPPVATTVWRARDLARCARRVERAHADGAAVLDEQVGGEPAARGPRSPRSSGGLRERALDLGAGGVAAGVDDAGDGVTALARRVASSAPTAVEARAEAR